MSSVVDLHKTKDINNITVSYVDGFLVRQKLKLMQILQCDVCKIELRTEVITNSLINIRQYNNIKQRLCNTSTKLFNFVKEILIFVLIL